MTYRDSRLRSLAIGQARGSAGACHPHRRPMDGRNSGHHFAGAGDRVLRSAAAGHAGGGSVRLDARRASLRASRGVGRARRVDRGEARARERHHRAAREPGVRDRGRQSGVRQRGPRRHRSRRRSDPADAVLLQSRDGGRDRRRGAGRGADDARVSARRGGDCCGDYATDAGDRHRLAQQPHRGGLPRAGAARSQSAVPRPRRLPRPRRGLRVLRLRAVEALLAGFDRRCGASHDLALLAVEGLRHGELARRLYGGARGLVGGRQQDPGHAAHLPAGGVAVRGGRCAAGRTRLPGQPHRATGPDAPRDLRGAERPRRSLRSARGGWRLLLPDSRRLTARLDDADRAPDPRAQGRDDPRVGVCRLRALLGPHFIRRARAARGQRGARAADRG